MLTEDIHFENITFGERIGKVDLETKIMFHRRSNIPTNTAMRTESCASVGRGMCNKLCARRCNRRTIVIVGAKY